MNKIGDGKNHSRIDIKKLFDSDGKINKYSLKMLILRCVVGILAVVLTAIITLALSGSFKNKPNGDATGIFSELDNFYDTDYTDSERYTENVSEVATDSSDFGGEITREIADLSHKEHGELYVMNKTGDPIVYNPYAEYEKYYDASDVRPIVLILHTDDQQNYRGDGRDEQSIVSIGEKIAERLNIAGIPSIHCSARHKGDTDADSYNNAEDSIEFYLEMYPSIKYIFDIGIDTDNELATIGNFDKSDAAQILLEVSGQNYDTREQNLHLAVKLRGMLNRGKMSVAREIMISRSVLNSRYVPYYLTVKIGTENNTSKEAKNSANALALTLAEYLNKQ